jgi:hypothetical protein
MLAILLARVLRTLARERRAGEEVEQSRHRLLKSLKLADNSPV